MNIDVLDRLHESGELSNLIQGGLISINVLMWYKIYKSYIFQISNGIKKTQAITDIADVFNVSERIVYRVIAKFENK
jgi:hypothetical protein